MNKNPYSGMKFDDRGQRQKIRQSFDSTIGQANNQAALAGSVQGVANVGRASADTYANVSSNRDRAEADVARQEVEFENWRKGQEAEWDANNAGFFDYLNFGAKLLQGATPFGQALGLFDTLLGKKPKTGFKATPSVYPPPMEMEGSVDVGQAYNPDVGKSNVVPTQVPEGNTFHGIGNEGYGGTSPGSDIPKGEGQSGAWPSTKGFALRPTASRLGGRRRTNPYLSTFNRW